MMRIKPVCVRCKVGMRTETVGALLVEMADFGPYKVWSADVTKCPGCGNEVVSGFGDNPVRQDHWEPDFLPWLEEQKANGVRVVCEYERVGPKPEMLTVFSGKKQDGTWEKKETFAVPGKQYEDVTIEFPHPVPGIRLISDERLHEVYTVFELESMHPLPQTEIGGRVYSILPHPIESGKEKISEQKLSDLGKLKRELFLRVRCSCGKTAGEHASLDQLTQHHYSYFHKERMIGCASCKGEGPATDWETEPGGTIECPNCGISYSESDPKCPHCGAGLGNQ